MIDQNIFLHGSNEYKIDNKTLFDFAILTVGVTKFLYQCDSFYIYCDKKQVVSTFNDPETAVQVFNYMMKKIYNDDYELLNY